MIHFLTGFAIIIVACLVFFYRRRKSSSSAGSFWKLQPVLHYYHLWNWFNCPRVIRPSPAPMNPYVCLSDITTLDIAALSARDWNAWLDLLRNHYLYNPATGNSYVPDKNHLVPYFEKHPLITTHLSIYADPLTDTWIGAISTRPIMLYLNRSNQWTSQMIYYYDYLCVDRSHRNKSVAPKLIQTHEYRISHSSMPFSHIGAFKREEELTNIVPIVAFSTTVCSISHLRKYETQPLSTRKIRCIRTQEDVSTVVQWIKSVPSLKIIMTPPDENLAHLIRTNNVMMYAIYSAASCIGCVCFKATCVSLEKDGEVLACTGVALCKTYAKDDFVCDFLTILQRISQKHPYKYVAIDGIGSAQVFIGQLHATDIIMQSRAAYYFYNYAHFPVHPCEAFVI